jgi:hypothetical protein
MRKQRLLVLITVETAELIFFLRGGGEHSTWAMGKVLIIARRDGRGTRRCSTALELTKLGGCNGLKVRHGGFGIPIYLPAVALVQCCVVLEIILEDGYKYETNSHAQ